MYVHALCLCLICWFIECCFPFYDLCLVLYLTCMYVHIADWRRATSMLGGDYLGLLRTQAWEGMENLGGARAGQCWIRSTGLSFVLGKSLSRVVSGWLTMCILVRVRDVSSELCVFVMRFHEWSHTALQHLGVPMVQYDCQGSLYHA